MEKIDLSEMKKEATFSGKREFIIELTPEDNIRYLKMDHADEKRNLHCFYITIILFLLLCIGATTNL